MLVAALGQFSHYTGPVTGRSLPQHAIEALGNPSGAAFEEEKVGNPTL
jgi:hypothetical protein